MTARYGIIFWMAIFFLVVYSVRIVFGVDNDHVCNETVSRFEPLNISYYVSYKICGRFWCHVNYKLAYELVHKEIPVMKRTCCPGYKNRSGICESECLPACVHGHCAQPNICTCDEHWDGNLCDNLSICFVRSNSMQAESRIFDSELKIPECHSRCTTRDVPEKILAESKNKTHFFISNRSPCNTNAEALAPQYWVGISIMIAINLSVISIIYINRVLRKNRRLRNTNKHEPNPQAESSFNLTSMESQNINHPRVEFHHEYVNTATWTNTSVIESELEHNDVNERIIIETVPSFASGPAAIPRLKPKLNPEDELDYEYAYVLPSVEVYPCPICSEGSNP